ncbi:MAG: hypothetical protein ACC660_01200, partial [Acidimicrobiales bacterium]
MTDTSRGEAEAARLSELLDVLAALPERNAVITTDGPTLDLAGALGVVGRFLGADEVAVWRLGPQGQVRRRDAWPAGGADCVINARA